MGSFQSLSEQNANDMVATNSSVVLIDDAAYVKVRIASLGCHCNV